MTTFDDCVKAGQCRQGCDRVCWQERYEQMMKAMADHPVGRSVVACPGCGQERWHGYGPCSKCGAPGTAR